MRVTLALLLCLSTPAYASHFTLAVGQYENHMVGTFNQFVNDVDLGAVEFTVDSYTTSVNEEDIMASDFDSQWKPWIVILHNGDEDSTQEFTCTFHGSCDEQRLICITP